MSSLGRHLFYLLTIIYMAVQPSYSAVSDPSVTMNPLEGKIVEEGLIRLTLPSILIEQAINEYLVASDANPERYIKEIKRFELDPIQKLIIIEGDALIPHSVAQDMDAIAGGKVFTTEHSFRLVAKLPSAQKLSLTSYFVLEILELNVGGQNYTTGATRIGEFLATMLSNTSFMDWILKDPEAPMPQGVEERDSHRIKQLFDSKTVMIRNQSVYLKLDFSKIAALSAYSSLQSFRLWNVAPVVLKGAGITALQIEAGLGVPGENWFNAIVQRGEGDAQSIESAQANLYEQLGNTQSLSEELKSYTAITKTSLNFPTWNAFLDKQIEELTKDMENRVRHGLSLENPIFKANPSWGYDITKEDTKAFILSRLLEMKRQALAETTILNGGSTGNALPLLTQRVSQRAISQGLRFARDFQFDNAQMFPELEVVLAPQIPGVIIRGLINVDMNTFMEMGLEGEGIDWGSQSWQIAGDVWSHALPFELSVRIHMFDEGEVGLDVKNFSILKGSEKISLSKDSGHGHLMATWTKMAIVEALTTLAMDDPAEALEEDQDANAQEDEFFRSTLSKISEQVSEYSRYAHSGQDEVQLLKLAEIDIAKNPFNRAGEQAVVTKVKYLFEDIVRFDDTTELVVFKIDPRLVAEKIYETSNTLQVWNLETLFDKDFNQTFIEASLGDGVRSNKYIDKIFSREERIDSQIFSGIDANEESSPSDLISTMKFSYFENFLNKVFSDASEKQLKDVNILLNEEKEQSHYLIRDLNISATDENRLKLNATIQIIDKKKNGILARLFSDEFKISQKAAQVSAVINLSTQSLSKYKDALTLADKEVFFGDEVLSIDLESAGLQLKGDTTLLEKAVGLIAGNVDFKGSTVAKKAKVLVLHFLKGYLHSTETTKNGNVELAGIKINRFAKLLAHKEELLIQLNPHIMGVSFDVRSVVNDEFNNRSVGTVISKADDSISFHFSTSGNMAAVDKGELLEIMKDSRELFHTIEGMDDFTKEDFLLLYDKALYNSDYTKLSLMHRLNRVLSNYQGVIDVVKTDGSVVAAINAQINSDFGFKSGEFNSRYLSGSGVDVMYFVSAAYFLKSGIDRAIKKIESTSLEIPYLADMKFKSKQLDERYIQPLMSVYEQNFLDNNKNIIFKGPTDWNYTYYSDALYCNSVYSVVSNMLTIKENRGE